MHILPWLLVWWIVVPGHSQEVHYKDFATQAECERYGETLPAHNSIVRWHCSQQ